MLTYADVCCGFTPTTCTRCGRYFCEVLRFVCVFLTDRHPARVCLFPPTFDCLSLSPYLPPSLLPTTTTTNKKNKFAVHSLPVGLPTRMPLSPLPLSLSLSPSSCVSLSGHCLWGRLRVCLSLLSLSPSPSPSPSPSLPLPVSLSQVTLPVGSPARMTRGPYANVC
jgi:hypothetical protein